MVSPSGVETVTARPDGAVGQREHDQVVLIENLVGQCRDR
jgi:hypothetical protein